ncbi:NlpC/P60 family protein [Actinomadura sp. LD22]|uniref:NlpC/P60 family protein n=1 Tax=Actinomadura physcomitrii TaxID=2650748 RepID=A0A6I4MDN0_9ACTN|nr:NlpC/P60 family protein [Actinomadura physcomitrii]MWA02117.1 NlpC/P60 family protein [Actinomadura physcomitrii]
MRTARFRVRALTVAGALVALSVTPHVVVPHSLPTAHADPDPSAKELKDQAFKLADQLEKLTEQYNGLKVKLEQSQRAAKVAAGNAERQQKSLEGLREKVGSLAATSYMQGGTDPTVSFISAQDPQVVLDRAATLNYFATQDSTQVLGLMQAMQSAQRARKSAEERAQQVTQLKAQLTAQKKKVTSAYEKVRGKAVKKDPTLLAKLPVIGEGKAAQALRYAMSKLGSPYVWGAAGPSTFDCSGLTMWAYRQVGINLPHYTGSQWNAGTHVSESQMQPGDLIFFYSDLHHMGMYVGGGKMIHAPHTGDVVRIASLAGRPIAGVVRVA